jgi:hypothetical protein
MEELSISAMTTIEKEQVEQDPVVKMAIRRRAVAGVIGGERHHCRHHLHHQYQQHVCMGLLQPPIQPTPSTRFNPFVRYQFNHYY